MDSLRKRNASDGDSGFDSALSSRSSSISLEESNDLQDFKVSPVTVEETPPSLRNKFLNIISNQEDIFQDVCTPELYIIRDRVSGREIMYKPPSRLSFSGEPQIAETYSAEDYDRHNPIPRSQIFSSRLQLELEKQVAKMDLVEIDLLMDPSLVPPPSLGIRVIGVNMIHGVPDKLNIYVKRVMENSVAGLDNRIRVNDHIVEVNGVSLVGVSQKLAAEALSSCAANPKTGFVHFVLAREKLPLSDLNTQVVDQKSHVVDLKPQLIDIKQNLHAPIVPQDSLGTDEITETVNTTSLVASPLHLSAVAVEGNPPPLLLPPSMLHCGESTAFIPISPKREELRLKLTELPGSVLSKISTYLSEEDKLSLSKANESFFNILVKNCEILHPSPALSGRSSPDLEIGKSLKHGLENLVEKKPPPNCGVGAKRRIDTIGMNRKIVRAIHPLAYRSCI